MENQNIEQANSIQIAVAISLTCFWILNILKEAYSNISQFLGFYKPVGPLLGLFLFSTLVFLISFIIFKALKIKNQKTAFLTLAVSSILFFLMVFPPFFEPLVGLLPK